MISIKIVTDNRILSLDHDPKDSLLDTLVKNKVYVTSPCAGNGTCGKCRVRVVKGHVHYKDSNNRFFSEDEIKKGFRLACESYTCEPITIEIPKDKDNTYSIESGYENNRGVINPLLKKHKVSLEDEILKKSISITKSINDLMKKDFSYSYEALKKLSRYLDVGLHKKDIYMVERDNLICNIFTRNCKLYGVAIDIGTTTIAMVLIDLESSEIIDKYAILNPQKKYGHDVISRINYASKSTENLDEISSLIRDEIFKSILHLAKKNHILFDDIHQVYISANTTMIQLLLGLHSHSLAVAPFTMITDSPIEYSFSEVFNYTKGHCKVTLTPSISAYVGGDITSGIISTNIHKDENISLLIDIGTNGEMVLGNRDKIFCVATAAGPAFEGATIKYGIGSIEGAISHVTIKDREVTYETIGDKSPVGICGSGIIDITAELIKNNIIKKSGRYNKEYTDTDGNFPIACLDTGEKIVFTQKDIREIQLAKSAIRSGIEILIREYGCYYNEIKNVYMAGGFGNKISIKSAAQIGLIPDELKEKVVFIGNTSLSGSIDMILDKSSQEDLRYIIDTTKYVELSTDRQFQSLFVDYMAF
ncbi:ASKHA domain-containing protein [Anaeromicrobium sediminis]|uniref:2Fe-2S ferredoxin-type domain-containing protein n=1 Tax=Anaeromicrobium sediminis TaxID=1478221 RepID=A0A267MM22_9FIRM|nr:ASKHA domain-containing protein [Anaeromicrobium sediminis]PAB60477.1 hypothetical protein CCE28_06155 [Anaeromicrobium sediminis]